jgi:predicted amidohydrolase YtcJ
MGQMSKGIPLLQAELDQYTMWAENAAKELAAAKEAAAFQAGRDSVGVEGKAVGLLCEAVSVMVALQRRDKMNTCQHEDTYRGGSIWEICSACGMKWADDMGGKPEWEDPEEWVAADRFLQAVAALK